MHLELSRDLIFGLVHLIAGIVLVAKRKLVAEIQHEIHSKPTGWAGRSRPESMRVYVFVVTLIGGISSFIGSMLILVALFH